MNCHIELNKGRLLWLNDPDSGLKPCAPPGFDDIDAPHLIKLLDNAGEGFRSLVINPTRFAQLIVRELEAVLPQLPPYSQPPTITIADDLASDLGLSTFPMFVADFIQQFHEPTPDESSA